ncbi:MAG TPA: hypothetical protein VHF06_06320 [Pseudonocardiaceae bacterium]|jgi:hypothetical protein|nr:hypothetical protein [Pseudonocardiaceae bacterium]
MNDERRRAALALVTGLTSVSAAAGAIGLITGTLELGATVTSRLPLQSPVLAGLALALVVAVPTAVVAYLATKNRDGHAAAASVAGLMLIGWIAVEAAVIQEFSWLQVLFAVVGVAVLFLGLPDRWRRDLTTRTGGRDVSDHRR